MSFTTAISSNIDDVIREVEAQRLPEPEYAGEILNDAEYARWLHDMMAYWVTNDSVLEANWSRETAAQMEAAASQGMLFGHERQVRAAMAALDRTVEYYKAVIGTKNTPGKFRPPPRPLHHGNWADDSGNLVTRYVSYFRTASEIIDFNPYDHPEAAGAASA